MGSDIVVFLLLLNCLFSGLTTRHVFTVAASTCKPQFPVDSARRSAQAAAANGVGLQVLVTSYTFTCSGIISSVTIGADESQGDDGFIFQIWRPENDGTFSLNISINTTGITRRSGEKLSFNTSVPVQNGDTIGYRLELTERPIHFLLDISNASRDAEIYRGSTDDAHCRIAPCDGNIFTLMRGLAPLINIELDEEGEGTEENRPELECIPVPQVMSCDSSNTPPSSSASSSSLPYSTTTPSEPTAVSDEEESGGPFQDLTMETLIVLSIGLLLFIVLVVLVIVLVACVFHKRKPTQFRFKSPPTGTLAGVRVISPETTTVLPSNNGVSIRRDYINSVMQTPLIGGNHSQSSSVDPLSSTESHDPDHTHRGRRMRSPLLPPDSPPSLAPPVPRRENGQLHTTAWTNREPSPSTTTTPKTALLPPSYSASPRSGSVPPSLLPATVPPPAAIALQISSATTPSIDSLPIFSSPRPSPPPSSVSVANTTDTNESTEITRSQNSFVSSSTKLEGKPNPYDHIETEWIIPHMRPRPASDATSRSSKYIYTYVPTEEQRRLIKLQTTGRYEVRDEVKEVTGYDRLKFFKESETYWSPATTASGLYAQLYENKYRELPREQILIQGKIGAGHFGSVSKGLWQLRGEGGEVMEGEGVQVAVKVVKTEAEEVQRVKLLQEAAIMGQFAHPNVVRLNGVVTVGDPTMIVLEYMPRGDLKTYLQRMRPQVSKRPLPKDTPKLFIKFGKDITAGMSYLARKNFVHRDLATRNILLSDNLTCKIGDFGMARDIAGGGSDYYKSHGGIIPVKWTAPEALNYNKYTSASDVWSYGMVLFEIWSLGHKPFHNLANPIAIALVTSKHCQAPPPGCPRPIYHLMVECWNPKNTQRPTFDCIQTYLDSPEQSLLQWSPSDLLPGKQAHVLGAPLVEGNNLYIDLQRTYQNQLLAESQANNLT